MAPLPPGADSLDSTRFGLNSPAGRRQRVNGNDLIRDRTIGRKKLARDCFPPDPSADPTDSRPPSWHAEPDRVSHENGPVADDTVARGTHNHDYSSPLRGEDRVTGEADSDYVHPFENAEEGPNPWAGMTQFHMRTAVWDVNEDQRDRIAMGPLEVWTRTSVEGGAFGEPKLRAVVGPLETQAFYEVRDVEYDPAFYTIEPVVEVYVLPARHDRSPILKLVRAGWDGKIDSGFLDGALPGSIPVPIAEGGTEADNAADARTNLGLGSAAELDADPDTTLAADSDDVVPTQHAVKTYVDGAVGGAVPAHATSHEHGGSDEIDVAGLSGELADPQPAKVSGLSALSSLDPLADYALVYDDSAAANKKVLLGDLAAVTLDRVTSQTKAGPSDASEVTLYSKSIAAGLLGSDKRLTLTASGTYINNSGTSKLLTLKIKFGATTLFATTSGNITTGGGNSREWTLVVILQEMGATNSQRASAVFSLSTAIAAASGVGGRPDPNGGAVGGGVASEDATAAKTLSVTFQHSASDASVEISIEEASLVLS